MSTAVSCPVTGPVPPLKVFILQLDPFSELKTVSFGALVTSTGMPLCPVKEPNWVRGVAPPAKGHRLCVFGLKPQDSLRVVSPAGGEKAGVVCMPLHREVSVL